jgi:hypothetical protein
MATVLRQVLDVFEQTTGPLSLAQVARELGVERGVLDGMIQHWVRKGKLRETNGDGQICGSCGGAEGCPFVTPMPRRYELANGDPVEAIMGPGCGDAQRNLR